MNRAFTLIELLVVIGIIGFLAAVVSSSLIGAKQRGNETALKSDLSTIQVQGSLYYEIGRTYGATTSSCAPTSNSVFKDSSTTIEDRIGDAITAAQGHANGGSAEVYCRASATAFAVAGKLPNNKFWCIDSIGTAKEKDTAPGSSTTNCNY